MGARSFMCHSVCSRGEARNWRSPPYPAEGTPCLYGKSVGRNYLDANPIRTLGREAGRFSPFIVRVSFRRTNMRSGDSFVKRVNTIYCAFLLGHSQYVANRGTIGDLVNW